jgi:hypothetical protein
LDEGINAAKSLSGATWHVLSIDEPWIWVDILITWIYGLSPHSTDIGTNIGHHPEYLEMIPSEKLQVSRSLAVNSTLPFL